MRKSMLLGILAAVPIGAGIAAGLAYVVVGSHDHGGDMEESIASEVTEITCPVWGTVISNARMTSGKSEYKGKTYYFCCPECKEKFSRDPERYVKEPPATPSHEHLGHTS